MKFILSLIFTFVLVFGPSNAFWSGCAGTDIPTIDSLESPQCNGDRCRAVRGEVFYARAYVTLGEINFELRTRLTAIFFGIGEKFCDKLNYKV